MLKDAYVRGHVCSTDSLLTLMAPAYTFQLGSGQIKLFAQGWRLGGKAKLKAVKNPQSRCYESIACL